MTGRTRRAALAIGVAALAGATLSLVGSAPLRASLLAAYRAFRDPTLLDPRPPVEVQVPVCAAALAEAPRAPDDWLAREFGPAVDEDLDDPEGATLASLVLPDLHVPVTRRTMRFVRFFARNEEGRAVFLQRYRRAAAYRGFIQHALREAGLPEDLLWVAAVESSFDPRAVSPAGAAGLWQFMPRTADVYGLEQSDWADERRSLARATTAAVAHLRDLYERFGRWDLALASYNLGHEGVLRALDEVAARRDTADRGPLGAAELAQAGAIPRETADYVPQIMAFALVAQNRARFGLDHADLEAAPPLDLGELAVPEGTRLRTVARAAGIPTSTLRDYNPQLLRDRVPPTGGEYLVTLPADRVARTLATFPAYLDHEVLAAHDADDPGSDALADLGWDASPASLRRPSDDPLPRRPRALGKNRLPAFIPPGQEPAAMPILGDPASLEAKLPTVLFGRDVGWRRAFEEDPLGLFSSARGLSTTRRRSSLKGREASIDKQLAFLDAPRHERVQRLWLPSGVAVEIRSDPSAPLVAVTAGVAAADDVAERPRARGESAASPALGEARYTIAVPPRALEVGIELAAGRLRLLLDEASDARQAAIRRRLGAGKRRALEKAPYGAAWLALGDALFPAGHPLEGAVIGARDDAGAARDLLLAESLRRERAASRATVTLSGDVDRALAEEVLARVLGRLPSGRGDAAAEGDMGRLDASLGPHPREDRIRIEDAVPAPRLLCGWIAPAEGGPSEAALRVAMEILAGPRVARLAKALAGEVAVASEVGGRLDLGARASVAALEIAPAAGRDAADVERRLDAELEALATAGPTWNELSLAKALLKIQLEKDLSRIQGTSPAPPGPRPVTGARLREALSPGSLERLLADLDEVSHASVRAVVRRTFARGHRVLVWTLPRDLPGGSTVAAAAGAGPRPALRADDPR